MATFARFAKAVVRRYGRRGTLWRQHPRVPKNPITAYQIWNEPSLPIYWCNRRPTRDAMWRCCARSAGRSSGRTAGRRSSRQAPAQQVGERRSDRALRDPDVPRRRAAVLRLARHRRRTPRTRGSSAVSCRSIRGLMNRHGDRRGRLWITEFGWGDHGPQHRFIVGAAGQARRITQAFERDQEAAASAAAERSRLLQLAGRARHIRLITWTCGASTRACLTSTAASSRRSMRSKTA